jgi:hypothetical protein
MRRVRAWLVLPVVVSLSYPVRSPARVSISVRAGDVTLAGKTAIGVPSPGAATRTRTFWLLGGAAVLLVGFLRLLAVLWRRRRARVAVVAAASPYAVLLGGPPLPGRPAAAGPVASPAAAGPVASPAGAMRPPARGRAAVPPARADE